jgi:uncharacterized protein YyaL (SSP411 family)
MALLVNRFPAGFSQLLCAVDFLAAGPREIVLAGEVGDRGLAALLATVRAKFLPQKVVALAHGTADAELMPLLAGRAAASDAARAYVCRHYACSAPVGSAEELARLLEAG